MEELSECSLFYKIAIVHISLYPAKVLRSNTRRMADAESPLFCDLCKGIIITQGGYFAGTALMLLKGKPTFAYAFSHYPEHKWKIQSAKALTAGKHTLVMNFDYAGGGVGKAAKVTLLVDGNTVATGDIPMTVPKRFSADETLDVGEDFGTPVNHDYDVPFRFTGKIECKFR
ncbi:MAG TPA: hypothetical protein VGN00_19995 [Puia sp.]